LSAHLGATGPCLELVVRLVRSSFKPVGDQPLLPAALTGIGVSCRTLAHLVRSTMSHVGTFRKWQPWCVMSAVGGRAEVAF
jgi:hypothetical protein